MGLRSAIERRGRLEADGKRLYGVISLLLDKEPADSRDNMLLAANAKASGGDLARISTIQMPDAEVVVIRHLSAASGIEKSSIELYPINSTDDLLDVRLRGSSIMSVYSLRPTGTGDIASLTDIEEFGSASIKPIDALRYGGGNAPAIIGNLLSQLGDFAE